VWEGALLTCVGAREAEVGAFEVDDGVLDTCVGALEDAFEALDGATLLTSVDDCRAVTACETTLGAFALMAGLDLADETLETLLGRLPYPSSRRSGRKTASMLLPSKSMTAAL